MHVNLERSIQSLQSKIEKLIHLHKKAMDDNLKLHAALDAFEMQTNDQIVQLEVLKNEKENLMNLMMPSTQELNEGMIVVSKDKLNEIVRDIDKCMQMLKSN